MSLCVGHMGKDIYLILFLKIQINFLYQELR